MIKKIGLLTYFKDDCAGQFYQALATIRQLKNIFPKAQVELVNIRGSKWRPWLRPSRCCGSIIRHISYNKARRKYFDYSYPQFTSSDYNDVVNYLKKKNYDLLVVGSDVCLKIDKASGNELPYFWLDNSLSVPKIVLSGSAEFTTLDCLSPQQLAKAAGNIKDFSFIGVRDQMTYDLMLQLDCDIKDRLFLMPDPTTSLAVQLDTTIPMLQQHKQKSGKKLCMVNLVNNNFCRALIDLLKQEYYIIEVGPMIDNSDTFYQPGVIAWSDMFNDFDLVVTASFHESIFAMKHLTPVIAIDCSASRINTDTGKSKTQYLMSSLGLAEHHINMFSGIEANQAYRQIIIARDNFDAKSVNDKLSLMGKKYATLVSNAVESIS